jgi:hypothetical protein
VFEQHLGEHGRCSDPHLIARIILDFTRAHLVKPAP